MLDADQYVIIELKTLSLSQLLMTELIITQPSNLNRDGNLGCLSRFLIFPPSNLKDPARGFQPTADL